MKKCDSCGKLIADSKDIMCPFCGAVSQKSTVCTHSEQEDRWNRSGSTYSFHGDNYKTDKTLNEPEVNINKMFSFGSETPREKHPREQKYKKPPIKKTKSGKKTSARTVVLVFVLLSAFISFVSNAGFFSEMFGDFGNNISYACYPEIVNVEIDDKSEVVLEFPEGLVCYDNEANNVAETAVDGEILVNEIPFETSGDVYYDYATAKGRVCNIEKDGDGYSVNGFTVSLNDSYIVLSSMIINCDGEECTVALPFDAIRITGDKISLYTVDCGEEGEAVFVPFAYNK